MSFINDNSNFINIELNVEMKGLTESEKLANYELKKTECRKRLKKSYLNCSNKLTFYKEAFQELSFYETNYLILNLFFEKDFYSLFTILSTNSFSNLRFIDEKGISYKFWKYMNVVSDEKSINTFLKLNFNELTDVNERIWNNNSNSKKFSQFFVDWLLESYSKVDDDKIIQSYLLFIKLWNSEELYSKDYDKQTVLFLYNLNRKFDELKSNGENINLTNLIKLLNNTYLCLLNNETINLPIFDNLNSTKNISDAYFKQKTELNQKIKLSEIIFCDYAQKSFNYIFNLMDENNEEIVFNKLMAEINKKLDNFILPSPEEIEEIKIKNYKIEKVNSFKQVFFRRLYIF